MNYRTKTLLFICLLGLSLLPIPSIAQKNIQEFTLPPQAKEGDYLPHTILLKYRVSTDKSAVQDINPSLKHKLGIKIAEPVFSSLSSLGARTTQNHSSKISKELALFHTVEIDSQWDLVSAIRLLEKDPLIAYAEPVYFVKPLQVPKHQTNDPQASSQQQYHLTQIKAFEAWSIAQGSPEVIVATLDGGCQFQQADLYENYQAPRYINHYTDLYNDLAQRDGNVAQDSDRHGTAVALCAAAVPNNRVGTAGTGYHCRVLPVQIFPDHGRAYPLTYTAQGILYAAQQGAKVINMSWGGHYPVQFIKDVLELVHEEFDVVLVAAAGNDNTQDRFYPASYEVVLSVGATDVNESKADFSSYNKAVDIMAPGKDLVLAPNLRASGTSFASPLVAGAAALLRAYRPDLSAKQVMDRLKTTADPIDHLSSNHSYRYLLGAGRLNMERMLTDPWHVISLESYHFTNLPEDGYLRSGWIGQMQVHFKSLFQDTEQAQVSLSCNSPFVKIQDSIFTIANLPARHQTSHAFSIQLADHIPANTIVTFRFTYQQANSKREEYQRVLLNPGIASQNQMLLSLNDRGELAVKDAIFEPLQGLYSKNLGPTTQEAGLLIAHQDAQGHIRVSDAVRSQIGRKERNFTIKKSLKSQYRDAFLKTTAVYEDISNHNQRIGVEITQNTYSWEQDSLNQLAMIEYQVQNRTLTGQDLDSLHVGIFVNWNIQRVSKLNWEEETNMAYAYYNQYGGHMGILILSDQGDQATNETYPIHYFAYDERAKVNLKDGFSEEEKYQLLAGLHQRKYAENPVFSNGELATMLSMTIPRLKLGEKRTIAYAFLTANSLAELKLQAEKARKAYQLLHQSPTPIVEDQEVCMGANAEIRPRNGKQFCFYDRSPQHPEARLIHRGASLTVHQIDREMTYYITGIDSLYQSPEVAVKIRPQSLNADFELPQRWNMEDTLHLALQSLGAQSFQWEITHLRSPSGTDYTFLGDTDDASAQPVIKWKRPGRYRVRLWVRNQLGCEQMLEKQLKVYHDISGTAPPKPEEEEEKPVAQVATTSSAYSIQVYPNPAHDWVQIQLENTDMDQFIKISDNKGQMVENARVAAGSETQVKIKVSHLREGIYQVKVGTAKESSTLRLYISR